MKGYGIQLSSGGEFYTLRDLDMSDLAATTGNHNQSFIRLCGGGGRGKSLVIQDCTFHDLAHGAGIKLYGRDKVLIEDCVFSDFRAKGRDEGLAIKMSTTNVTVRRNRFASIPKAITANAYLHSGVGCRNIEILHNLVNAPSGLALYLGGNGGLGEMFIHRNTLIGKVAFLHVGQTEGPVHLSQNVIVNDSPGDKITKRYCKGADRITAGDNLCASPADGVLDSEGRWVKAHARRIGVYGHQLPD